MNDNHNFVNFDYNYIKSYMQHMVLLIYNIILNLLNLIRSIVGNILTHINLILYISHVFTLMLCTCLSNTSTKLHIYIDLSNWKMMMVKCVLRF